MKLVVTANTGRKKIQKSNLNVPGLISPRVGMLPVDWLLLMNEKQWGADIMNMPIEDSLERPLNLAL